MGSGSKPKGLAHRHTSASADAGPDLLEPQKDSRDVDCPTMACIAARVTPTQPQIPHAFMHMFCGVCSALQQQGLFDCIRV